MLRRLLRALSWLAIALLGALSFYVIALRRGEPVNALWFVVAALCCYSLGYRIYSKFIACNVLVLDDRRATPAERLHDGRDFVLTNKWVVFGHHFAAIAGPGPLVGPVLAAQFGYLPGTLWILLGAVLGGCVQDFVILAFSVRRNGKSLGQMAQEEIGKVGGFVSFLAVLSILTILLGVVALIVVNALKASPWGTFTIAMTIPIALAMGVYLRNLRPGKTLEASLVGFALVLASIWAGQWVSQSPYWAAWFTFTPAALAGLIMVYGFAASALPVWLLLAPRDYLSTFVKLGTIAILALGLLLLHPTLQMPAFTRFAADGSGPVFAGKVFPFVFITIACGAVSGFHSLISSGTTPKMIAHESETRMVGYGAMAAESFVAVMAMVAACVLTPGVYFSVNSPAGIVGSSPAAATAAISSWGFSVTPAEMGRLAGLVGEQTLFNRSGGAPAFALGMAHIFSRSLGGERMMALWYHFAIMFEALFILTILDAGTRVARFMLQEWAGAVYAPLGRTNSYAATTGASAVVVAAWGYFLWQGVRDPLGGINSLWPLFGIANQLLAAVALCIATTIVIKTRPRYMAVTLAPLAWLVAVTFSGAYEKIFSPDPRIGFLAHARELQAARQGDATARLIFNDRLDAAATALLVLLIVLILSAAARRWVRALRGEDNAIHEAAFVESRLGAEAS